MKSIRKQLFVIMIFISLAPMLVIGIGGMVISDRTVSGITLNMMDNHARDILRRSEDRLTYLEQSFVELSTNQITIEAIQDLEHDFAIQKDFHNYLYTSLLSKPEVTSILFIREDQSLFGYNASSFFPSASPPRIYRENVLNANACEFLDHFTDEFAYPDFQFYNSPLTNEATSLLMCHRIRNPATYEPMAVMIVHINFLKSSSLFDNIMLWEDEEIVLLHSNGNVIASTRKDLVGTQRTPFASSMPVHRQSKQEHGKTIYSGIQGKHGIEIQVSVPQTVLHATGRRLLFLLVALLLFTAALLAFFFLLIKRRFFGKLGSLSQILHTKEQTLFQPIEGEWGDDEIGDLVEGYNIVTHQAREQFVRERERLERLKQLELESLQSQIKPHFLYNTLDVGVWYAKEGNAQKIQELLIKLSRYYRLSLSSGDSLITIKDELHHAMLYLEMEQMRMSCPFEIIVDVPPELTSYYINKITLQPIVENCVKHGIKKLTEGDGIISISGCIYENHIELIVDDNGVGMSDTKLSEILFSASEHNSSLSFAVSNVHRRLSLYHGPPFGLRYYSEQGIGTSVKIILPRMTDVSGTVEGDAEAVSASLID